MKNNKCIISYLEENFTFFQKNSMNYKFSIRNLDNPGWNSFIPMPKQSLDIDWVSLENSEEDWIFWRISNGFFEFSCSPLNLAKSFSIFFKLIEAENIGNNSYDLINALDSWFSRNCNGDWEHSNIVCIESLYDKWKVNIGFYDLVYPYEEFMPCRIFKSGINWYKYDLENKSFIGESSSRNLHKLLEGFIKNINIFEQVC